jgi:SAM-dependent methyltransferase
MKLARYLGRDKLAWSLRRLHCPVSADALVLEVGSGGNPYFRSNVLLDAYESTSERHWVPLVADRPTVLAFVESMPFKDKAFDFVIASHVLEHAKDPARFLSEMQRVGKAGYIEVPDAFMERINPYPDHRLEITVRNGRLLIRKKRAWHVDPELVELYEDRVKNVVTKHAIPNHPFEFHVRYYWQDRIDYEILNPECPSLATAVDQEGHTPVGPSLRARVHGVIQSLIRRLFSQHDRNRKIDLTSLLRCTSCHTSALRQQNNELICKECGRRYPVRNGVPDMTDA